MFMNILSWRILGKISVETETGKYEISGFATIIIYFLLDRKLGNGINVDEELQILMIITRICLGDYDARAEQLTSHQLLSQFHCIFILP